MLHNIMFKKLMWRIHWIIYLFYCLFHYIFITSSLLLKYNKIIYIQLSFTVDPITIILRHYITTKGTVNMLSIYFFMLRLFLNENNFSRVVVIIYSIWPINLVLPIMRKTETIRMQKLYSNTNYWYFAV